MAEFRPLPQTGLRPAPANSPGRRTVRRSPALLLFRSVPRSACRGMQRPSASKRRAAGTGRAGVVAPGGGKAAPLGLMPDLNGLAGGRGVASGPSSTLQEPPSR